MALGSANSLCRRPASLQADALDLFDHASNNGLCLFVLGPSKQWRTERAHRKSPLCLASVTVLSIDENLSGCWRGKHQWRRLT